MPIVAFVNMSFTALFATFTNIFFNVMTPTGFFVTAAGIQVVCFIFVWFLVKETKGNLTPIISRFK